MLNVDLSANRDDVPDLTLALYSSEGDAIATADRKLTRVLRRIPRTACGSSHLGATHRDSMIVAPGKNDRFVGLSSTGLCCRSRSQPARTARNEKDPCDLPKHPSCGRWNRPTRRNSALPPICCVKMSTPQGHAGPLSGGNKVASFVAKWRDWRRSPRLANCESAQNDRANAFLIVVSAWGCHTGQSFTGVVNPLRPFRDSIPVKPRLFEFAPHVERCLVEIVRGFGVAALTVRHH